MQQDNQAQNNQADDQRPVAKATVADHARAAWQNFMNFADFLDVVWARVNNLTETNYQLACQLAQEGHIEDAIFRFKVTLWLAPEHMEAMYNLACLYRHIGRRQEAIKLYRKVLMKNPDHENALFMVSTINPELLKPEKRPTVVPPLMLLEHFESLAFSYDEIKRQQGYRLPIQVQQLLSTEFSSLPQMRDLVDLGCGTGQSAVLFRDDFPNIVGVDISQNMIDIAYKHVDRRGVKAYNRLIHQDARYYMQQPDTPTYDVILAIDLFPYLGDLEPLIPGVAAHLNPGGLFACSFDGHQQSDSYGVLPKTGYFGHGLDYVNRLMQAQGMEIVRNGEVQADEQRYAQVCFYRKPMDASR